MISHDESKPVSGKTVNHTDKNTTENCKVLYSSFTEFLRDYYFQKNYDEAGTIDVGKFNESLKERIRLGENARAEFHKANLADNPEDAKKHHALEKEYTQKLKKLEDEALKKDHDRIESATVAAKNIDFAMKGDGSWDKMDSQISHTRLQIIRKFLHSLHIDMSVLKCGKSYYYTYEVVVLFRWILDAPAAIRTQYQKGEFARIPFLETHGVYLKIIAAIESVSDSAESTKEKKAEQINKLTEFLTEKYHGWDIREYQPQNPVLDAILNSVWFFSMKQHWAAKYKEFERTQYDRDWQCVIDHVYMDLLTKKILSQQINENFVGASKKFFQISNILPNRYESMKIKRYWERTEVNPNDVPRKGMMIHTVVHLEQNKGKKHTKR